MLSEIRDTDYISNDYISNDYVSNDYVSNDNVSNATMSRMDYISNDYVSNDYFSKNNISDSIKMYSFNHATYFASFIYINNNISNIYVLRSFLLSFAG